jgi:hypothetical protein
MTCFADFSLRATWLAGSAPCLRASCHPGLRGTPALRKYLLTMMSVASWLHVSGTSASFISKTTAQTGRLTSCLTAICIVCKIMLT